MQQFRLDRSICHGFFVIGERFLIYFKVIHYYLALNIGGPDPSKQTNTLASGYNHEWYHFFIFGSMNMILVLSKMIKSTNLIFYS